jgi:hypothetical protein
MAAGFSLLLEASDTKMAGAGPAIVEPDEQIA